MVYTFAEIAESFILWQQYVDPDGVMKRAEFEETSIEEKVRLQTAAFGRTEEAAKAAFDGDE